MKNKKLLKRLACVQETPVVPAWMLNATKGRLVGGESVTLSELDKLENEASTVRNLRQKFASLPPIWPLEDCLL